jgi:peptidoglycan hydrolase CwlO-like protein
MRKKIIFLSFLFFTSTLLLFYSSTLTYAQTADELDAKIAELTAKITAVKNSAKTLSSEIGYYDDQIALSSLKITQSERYISSINSKIDQLENSLKSKSHLLAVQISKSYKQGAIDPVQLIFSTSDFSQFIAKYKYAQLLQEINRRFLSQAQRVQSDYAQQKIMIQDAQKKIETQKIYLTSLRATKDNLLKQTKNDEATYQKLLADAIAQREAITSFIDRQGGASLLSNQTVCNDWGCYYNQRDTQWGTSFLGDSKYTVASFGCLITSISMVASHYGINIKPKDIALTTEVFYGNTGYVYYNISVNGTNISRSYTANIDTQLAAGKPVIVGVYKGPAHFVVLKSGSNGNYVMHDPYIANGNDIKFTDHYPVSSITYAGTLSFN